MKYQLKRKASTIKLFQIQSILYIVGNFGKSDHQQFVICHVVVQKCIHFKIIIKIHKFVIFRKPETMETSVSLKSNYNKHKIFGKPELMR